MFAATVVAFAALVHPDLVPFGSPQIGLWRGRGSMVHVMLSADTDQTRTSITVLILALIAVAFGLVVLTAWYWRHTDPKHRVERSGPEAPLVANPQRPQASLRAAQAQPLRGAGGSPFRSSANQRNNLDADAWLWAHEQLDRRVVSQRPEPGKRSDTDSGTSAGAHLDSAAEDEPLGASSDPVEADFTGLDDEVWTAIADAVLRQATSVPVRSDQPTN